MGIAVLLDVQWWQLATKQAHEMSLRMLFHATFEKLVSMGGLESGSFNSAQPPPVPSRSP
jgi:hypothetical protein